MKTSLLLPHKYKKIGWILTVIGLIFLSPLIIGFYASYFDFSGKIDTLIDKYPQIFKWGTPFAGQDVGIINEVGLIAFLEYV